MYRHMANDLRAVDIDGYRCSYVARGEEAALLLGHGALCGNGP